MLFRSFFKTLLFRKILNTALKTCMRYKISKKAKKVNRGSKIKETVRFRIIRCVCLFAKPSKPKYHYLFYKLTLNRDEYDNHESLYSFRLMHGSLYFHITSVSTLQLNLIQFNLSNIFSQILSHFYHLCVSLF